MSRQDDLRAWYFGSGSPWDYERPQRGHVVTASNPFNPSIDCSTCGKTHLTSVSCDPQDLADVAEREADRRESSLIDLSQTVHTQAERDEAYRRLDRALAYLARSDRRVW